MITYKLFKKIPKPEDERSINDGGVTYTPVSITPTTTSSGDVTPHTHIIADVTNLQTTLDSKVNTSDVVTTATANKILKLDSSAKLPTSITGNAATATKLETARTINGISFDGTANITTSSWGTSRTITIGNTGKSVNGSANVSWTLAEIGAATTTHTHSPSEVGLGNVTNDAQLKRASGDFNSFTLRTSLLDGDLVLLETGDGNYIKMKTTLGNIKSLVNSSVVPTTRRLTINGTSYDLSADRSWAIDKSSVGLASVTNDAQLKRASGDFNSFTEKTSLASSDVILIEDSAASYAKKKATISSITSSITSVNYANEAGKATEIIPTNYPLPIAPTVTVKYIDNGKVRLYPVDEQGWQDFGFIADEAYSSTFATKLQTPRTLTIGNTGKNFDGSANVSWTLAEIGAAAASHTHSNYTPYASNSQTIPANTPSGNWYRIATSSSGVGRCDGIFEVEYAVSGYHQRVSFRVSSMYNTNNSIQITKLGGSKYANDTTFVIQSARVVYYPNTYSGVYAYVEVFVTNPNTTTNATLYVRMVNAIGWSLTTGAGSIPTNYTAIDLSLKNYNPIYNTNDKRGVVSPYSGILNIDLRLSNNETVVSNITQNTTININGLYDGAAGTIMLYLNGTYTITLGTMTNDVGAAVTKHTSGTFSSLAAGYYIIGYRVLPDASGTWRVFFNISSKYN